MGAKQALGALLTFAGLALYFYGIGVQIAYGKVANDLVTPWDAYIFASSIFLILLGPWLWFGEIPEALKRFVEAKLSREAIERGRGAGR